MKFIIVLLLIGFFFFLILAIITWDHNVTLSELRILAAYLMVAGIVGLVYAHKHKKQAITPAEDPQNTKSVVGKDSDEDPVGEIDVKTEPILNQQTEKHQVEDPKAEIQAQSMNLGEIKKKYIFAYGLLTWDVGNGERVVLGYAGKIYEELNDAFTELAEIMAQETGRDIMELWEWPDDLTFSSPEFLPCLEKALEIVQRVPKYVSRPGS